MNVCMNCVHWVRHSPKSYGNCHNEKFVVHIPDQDQLGFWHYDGTASGMATGEKFGCIHFEIK